MHETDLEPDTGPTDFGISGTSPDSTRKCTVAHARGLGWPSFNHYRDFFGDRLTCRRSPLFTSTGLLLFSEFVRMFVREVFNLYPNNWGLIHYPVNYHQVFFFSKDSYP